MGPARGDAWLRIYIRESGMRQLRYPLKAYEGNVELHDDIEECPQGLRGLGGPEMRPERNLVKSASSGGFPLKCTTELT